MNNLEIVILAAGKGTRMISSIPKVLHPLGGKPIIEHVLDTARSLKPKKIHLILNKEIKNEFVHLKNKINLIIQKKQLGTGDAVNVAIKSFQKNSKTFQISFQKRFQKNVFEKKTFPTKSPRTIFKTVPPPNTNVLKKFLQKVS